MQVLGGAQDNCTDVGGDTLLARCGQVRTYYKRGVTLIWNEAQTEHYILETSV